VKTDQLRFLGVASKERVAAAPDVPTLDSAGVKGFDVPIWYGVLAPAGTPPDILARYNTTLNEILRSPQVVEKLAKQGLITTGGSAASFGTFLKNERDKWEKVVTEAGIPKVE
jgi:tripartite-type tricarboxylate transporter receptor subunit TctC